MNLQRYVQLIRDHYPEIEVRSATPVLEGWDSVVLEVNGGLIFKFPRHPQAEACYEMEKLLLDELGTALSVDVPDIEFDCRVEEQDFSRFIGYRKITGEPLSHSRLVPPRDESMSRHLAAVLSVLHSFPIEKAIDSHVPAYVPASWREEHRRLYQSIRDNAFDMMDNASRCYTEALFEGYLNDDANFRFEPALVHRDLGREHILCDYERGIVKGIIDWGDAAVGDPAIDFVGILIECGRDFAERVAAGYSGDVDMNKSFWKRAEFYRAIGPYHEILYGLDTSRDEFVRSGVATIARQASGN